ncbi:MAG: [FeFe] hydrogenase H-cluster maturation GTPase HydF [Clostridiales bacterium]|nr:[FeFe] hydrogenase H-cluster maturation GTPase HydF [Clostridiales bacterium]
MSLTNTPSANRLHIGIFGRRNSGKSSLINALTGQDTALVSDRAGTTTDPVYKAMEIHGLGPCMLIDTAGFDDEGDLGRMRVEATEKAAEKTEIGLLVFSAAADPADLSYEKVWAEKLKQRQIPLLVLVNKTDLSVSEPLLAAIRQETGLEPLCVSARTGAGMDRVVPALIRLLPADFGTDTIAGRLVSPGDTVLLVMPQDIQAPKGRLILPQVQTIRDLLDHACIVTCCTADGLDGALAALSSPPKLIITDSQVFPLVYEKKPADSLLTSFSVLFAAYKGDIDAFAAGAAAIDRLTPQSRVLIAEACTHAPLSEDIGRVKLPRMLRKRAGQTLEVDVVSGADFPEDLSPYDLVIHCGGCMFNRKYVLSRLERAGRQGVPMTNYGVAIAKLTGILDKITW